MKSQGYGPTDESVTAAAEESVYDAINWIENATQVIQIPALFVNERRALLTRAAVYYLVRKAGEAAGLGRPLYPHLLRRAAGVKLVGEGHDVRLVQDYLGLRTARSVLRFVPESPPENQRAERFTILWTEA